MRVRSMSRSITNIAGPDTLGSKRFQDADMVLQAVPGQASSYKVLKSKDFSTGYVISEMGLLRFFSKLQVPIDVLYLPAPTVESANLNAEQVQLVIEAISCWLSDRDTGSDPNRTRKFMDLKEFLQGG